jgi:hypothetical protein
MKNKTRVKPDSLDRVCKALLAHFKKTCPDIDGYTSPYEKRLIERAEKALARTTKHRRAM